MIFREHGVNSVLIRLVAKAQAGCLMISHVPTATAFSARCRGLVV
jgi:hypothetical protein